MELGSSAQGAVFLGDLQGTPVAVKVVGWVGGRVGGCVHGWVVALAAVHACLDEHMQLQASSVCESR